MASRSKVPVLVATNIERDAMLHAASAAGATSPRPRFLRHHTVFETGPWAGVLVAPGEQGGALIELRRGYARARMRPNP